MPKKRGRKRRFELVPKPTELARALEINAIYEVDELRRIWRCRIHDAIHYRDRLLMIGYLEKAVGVWARGRSFDGVKRVLREWEGTPYEAFHEASWMLDDEAVRSHHRPR